MAEHMFEILRTRTVVIDERIEASIEVPDSVPEDEREDWVMDRVSADEPTLELPNSDWETTDENETSEYDEVTEF